MTLDLACAAACVASYTDPVTWQRGNCHVLLAESDGVHIIAFRGTKPDSFGDWLTDLEAWTCADHPELGAVHAGFLADVEGVAQQIMHDMAGKTLAVVGHSKGGSEAQVFSGMLCSAGTPPVRLITYGAARVMACDNQKLRALLRPLNFTYYRNANDPVPIIPPDLCSPGAIMQIGSTGFELDIVDDHYLTNYLQAVQL